MCTHQTYCAIFACNYRLQKCCAVFECIHVHFKHSVHKALHLPVHTVMFTGKASQGISLTTLLVISGVLGTALVVGSLLFAMTMWRMRAKGRVRSRRQARSNTVTKGSGATCTLCPCMGRKRPARCNRAHILSNGLQLQTIEALQRGTNVFSLASRDSTIRQSDADSSESQPPSIPERVGDPPYGYISPAAINIPPFRASKRSTVSEGRVQALRQQKASMETPEEYIYMYTASEGGPRRPVCRERCIASLSDSIYSIPGSDTTLSMEDEYDNTPSYLKILPSWYTTFHMIIIIQLIYDQGVWCSVCNVEKRYHCTKFLYETVILY